MALFSVGCRGARSGLVHAGSSRRGLSDGGAGVNVDEVLADPRGALGLTDDEVLVNVIVLGEYVSLAADAEEPNRRRLTMVSSDELEPWTSIGMLRFAQMRENAAVVDAWKDGGE